MLDAFLQDDDYFSELLRYCIVLYELMPRVLKAKHDMRSNKEARELAAIAIVTAGYGGDMSEVFANELLEDMDFVNNKVKCRKIEVMMMPQMNKMVEAEMK